MSSPVALRTVCASCRAANPPESQHCLRCGATLGLAGDQSVRGPDLSRPIGDWSVLGVSTHFVGRAAELGRLVETVGAAIDDRAGRLLLLRGPAGSGKTRLLARLHAEIEERGLDALFLQATVRQDDPSPWSAIGELLRQRFYLPPGASTEVWQARLADGARALLGPERGADVASLLATLIGLHTETHANAPLEAAIDALIDLVRADAAREPMVIVLDDADAGSGEARRLAASLLPAVRSAPIVVICACDAEATPAAFGLRDDEPDVEIVDLRPLDDECIRDHVRGLLRRCADLPASLVDTIAEHAFGNPLAAEELVRICIAEGVIDIADDAWTVVEQRVSEITFPDTFDALVSARLACLSAGQRGVLEIGAVIGAAFWPGAVLAAQRSDDVPNPHRDRFLQERRDRTELHASLEQLAALDLVQRAPAHDLPGEPAWQFTHAVERRALADGVDPGGAERIHEMAADWLLLAVDEPSEAQMVVVAEHFELGGRPDRAAPWFALLADRFRGRWANERARDLYLRALWIVDPADTQLRLRLLHDLASVLHVLGELEASVPILEEMAALAWRSGQQSRIAVAFNKLGRAWRSLGRYEDAGVCLRHALELFEQVGDVAGVAMTLDDLGRIDWLRGDYPAAQERYERALSLRREHGQQRAVATSLHHLGTLLVHRGDFRGALENFREALDLLRQVQDLRGISEALNAIGVILLERGETDSALTLWREALSTAEQSGDRVLRATVLNNIGELELTAGRLDAAFAALTQSITLASAAGDRRIVADATRNLAALESRRANGTLAITLAEEALQIARELGSRLLEGTALRTLAELQGHTVFGAGDDAPAADDSAWRDAIAIFESLGNTAELGRTWYGYGTTLVERGELVQGRKYLEMARDVFERLEMRRVLSQARTLISSL